MREELKELFDRELSYLRRLGSEFADRHKSVGSRLRLKTETADPHVERLLEGFALLAARVHLRLDDDFPEVPEALLSVVAPQYLRPVPSLTVVEFVPDAAQGSMTTALHVKRDSQLYSRDRSRPRCTFQTCYETHVWPLGVAEARWLAPDALDPNLRAAGAVGALSVVLRTHGAVPFGKLEIPSLRFFLNGERSTVPATLYELLCNNGLGVVLRDADRSSVCPPVTLPRGAVRPVGFEEGERLFPYPRHAHTAYALLHEYFALPSKYLFIDVQHLRAAAGAGFGPAVELQFPVSAFERPTRRERLLTGVSAQTVRLGCTPAVNLFTTVSEPVAITQRRDAYPLVADRLRRESTEIYSVDRVEVTTFGASEPIAVEPLYALRHARPDALPRTFWYVRRGLAGDHHDGRSELQISFVDQDGRLTRPEHDVATARLTCHNGGVPSTLETHREGGDFDLHGGGALERIDALIPPTPVAYPPVATRQFAMLVSLLSLNHMSIAADAAPLRELLRLQIFDDDAPLRQHVDGVVGVASAADYARVTSPEYGTVLARGRRVEVELDETHFDNDGAYVFASVLERFLAQYASLNSFTRLVARSRQRTAVMGEWAPRAGCRVLS